MALHLAETANDEMQPASPSLDVVELLTGRTRRERTMQSNYWELKVRFTNEVLGTLANKEVTSEFIQSKALAAGVAPEKLQEELETLPEMLEAATTVFPRYPDGGEGVHVMLQHQVRGYLKAVALAFNGVAPFPKNFRSKVTSYLFVAPRFIRLTLPEGQKPDFCERPLRAETALGPRVTLARSESLPSWTKFACVLKTYKPDIFTETYERVE